MVKKRFLKPTGAAPILALASFVIPLELMANDSADSKIRIGATVEISRSHSYCWFPTVHRFRSGEILVGMLLSPDQAISETVCSAYCLSRDGGLTWSRRYTMGHEAGQDGAWSEVPDSTDAIWHLGCHPESLHPGDLKNFYNDLTKFGNAGRTLQESRDPVIRLREAVSTRPTGLGDYSFDGNSTPVPDTRITSQPNIMTWGSIIRGPAGDLLCGAYGESKQHSGGTPDIWYNHEILLRSTDDGKTWSEYATVAAVPSSGPPSWMGTEGPGEGTLALLPGRGLYVVYRTGGMMGNEWSADGGRT